MLKIPTTSVLGLILTPIVVYVTRWYDIGKLFEGCLPTVVFLDESHWGE